MLTHRDQTILGNIPSDWQAKPLRSLISEHFAGDWGDNEGEQSVAVIRSTNFTNDSQLDFSDVATRYFTKDKAEKFGLRKGDLLVERSGGGPDQPVGRIGFIERDMPGSTVSNFVQVLRPDPTTVDAGYLGWALFELQRTGIVERVQQQSTQMRNLNWRDYQRLLLPWPSLDEQRRIAAALNLVDDAINKARVEREATRDLRKAAAFALLERGIPLRHPSLNPTKHWTIPRLSRNSGKALKTVKTERCNHVYRTRRSKISLDAPRLSSCFALLSARKPDSRTDRGTPSGRAGADCSSHSTAASIL